MPRFIQFRGWRLLDWPAPVDGWKLRSYDLDAALADGEKTRVFRCSNLMINILLTLLGLVS